MRWILTLALACNASACSRAKSEKAGLAAESAATVSSELTPAKALLDIREEAPQFEAVAHTGMRFGLRRFLSKPALVHFCPSLSADCDRAVVALRDQWFHLHQKLAMIIFVVPDDNVRLREYAYERQLPFLLVGDVEQKIARAFGVGLASAAVTGTSASAGTTSAPEVAASAPSTASDVAFLLDKDAKVVARYAAPFTNYVADLFAQLQLAQPSASASGANVEVEERE